jgi:hypothetical protein
MANEVLQRDQNHVTVLGGVTDDSNQYITMLRVDPTTKRLLISATGLGTGDVVGPASAVDGHIAVFDGTTGKLIKDGGALPTGTVSTVSVVSANGFAGTVATATTTPAITLSTTITGILKGNGTAISAGTAGTDYSAGTSALATGILKSTTTTGALSIAVAGDFPTLNQNTTGSAATLTTTRTIWGQNFNGSANVTGTLALGASDLTMTGSIAATGTRVTKGWFTDIESTNMPTVGGTAILTSLTAPQFTTIELGAASDTTLSRVSAGVIAVEGVTVPTISSTSTLTNKRINPRIVSAASYTTDTGTSLDVSTCDEFVITAQAGALKFNNPSGTPTEGCKLIVRIKDDGTARALTYDTQFRAMGTALPSTTVLSKTLYMGFIFNSTDTKWDLVAAAQEA